MNEAADEPEKIDPRIICFDDPHAAEIFEKSVSRLIGALAEQSQSMYLHEENVLRMNHGETWVRSARATDSDATMHRISAEWTIPYKNIADNDLSLIARSVLPVSEEMQKQFARNVYGVVGAAAVKVGNVVDATASGSIAESFVEMMSKVELGVGRDGTVSMPQLHLHPSMFDRVKAAMDTISPELEAELERLKAVKTREAYAREDARKAKFKGGSQ